MQEVYTLSIIIIELALFFETSRRMPLLPAPHGVMFYLICGKIVLYLFAEGLIQYNFIFSFSTMAYQVEYFNVVNLLFVMFLFYYSTTVGISFSKRYSDIEISINSKSIAYACTITTSLALAHVIVVDMNVAASNTRYLMMGSANGLKDPNAFSIFVHQLRILFGLFSWSLLSYTLNVREKRFRKFAIIVFPAALWFFLFELAGHSRLASLYLVTYAIVGLSVRGRGAYFSSLSSLLLAIVVLLSALSGRSSGSHGFMSIFQTLSNISTYLNGTSTLPIVNVFEGIFGSAEAFGRTFEFHESYKYLSFSPLPSFIDGFSTIRRYYEIRLSRFAPAPSILEVIHFGWPFIMIAAVIQFSAIRLSISSLARSFNVLTIALNGLLFFGLYIQFAYPVRNTYRYFYIVIIAVLIILIADKLRNVMSLEKGMKKLSLGRF